MCHMSQIAGCNHDTEGSARMSRERKRSDFVVCEEFCLFCLTPNVKCHVFHSSRWCFLTFEAERNGMPSSAVYVQRRVGFQFHFNSFIVCIYLQEKKNPENLLVCLQTPLLKLFFALSAPNLLSYTKSLTKIKTMLQKVYYMKLKRYSTTNLQYQLKYDSRFNSFCNL